MMDRFFMTILQILTSIHRIPAALWDKDFGSNDCVRIQHRVTDIVGRHICDYLLPDELCHSFAMQE